SPQTRWRAFLRCWTRKEAYVKARGAGLALRLDRFVVPVVAHVTSARIRHLDAPAEDARFALADLDVALGFAAALVVDGALPRVSFSDGPACWHRPNRGVATQSLVKAHGSHRL